MKTLGSLGIVTMSVEELHDATAPARHDKPVVVLLADDTVVPIERLDWDQAMECYVLRETAPEPARVN